MINPQSYTKKILVSQTEIEALETRLAAAVSRDAASSNRPLVAVAILKGSVFFYTDLIKKLTVPVELEFMKVSSYGNGARRSTGDIRISLDLNRADYADLDILLVEDIVDSGRTLAALTALFRERGAHSVRTCTMLDKPSRREVDFTPDYIGQTIPDEFVFGYGLDYDENLRDVPYIGVLDSVLYEKERALAGTRAVGANGQTDGVSPSR